MQEQVIQYFETYRTQAVVLSIVINILIAAAGFIPSYFVTGANITFFGFWKGFYISLAGEVIGAVITFYIYRKGLKKVSLSALGRFPKVQRLVNSEGYDAFFLILLFRLFPFVPSGVVTLAGAVGRVSVITFGLASSLGKIPALLIEATAVFHIMKIGLWEELLLELGLVFIIFVVWKRLKKR